MEWHTVLQWLSAYGLTDFLIGMLLFAVIVLVCVLVAEGNARAPKGQWSDEELAALFGDLPADAPVAPRESRAADQGAIYPRLADRRSLESRVARRKAEAVDPWLTGNGGAA